MVITDIRMRKLDGGKLKAAASVTLDNEIVIHDVKVIEGMGKIFIAMPSKKLADGTYMDIVHPINKEAREKIEQEILGKYRAMADQEEQDKQEEI